MSESSMIKDWLYGLAGVSPEQQEQMERTDLVATHAPKQSADIRNLLNEPNNYIAVVYDLEDSYGEVSLKTITGLYHTMVREYLTPIERMVNGEHDTTTSPISRLIRLQNKYRELDKNFINGFAQAFGTDGIEVIQSCIENVGAIHTREAHGIDAETVLNNETEPCVGDVIQTLDKFSTALTQLAQAHTCPNLGLYAEHVAEATAHYRAQAVQWAQTYDMPSALAALDSPPLQTTVSKQPEQRTAPPAHPTRAPI